MNNRLKTALSLIMIQVIVTVVAGMIALVFYGARPSVAVHAGGGICLLSTIVFSLRVFSGGTEFEPRRFMRRLFIAETQKLLLTVFLFFAAINWSQLHLAGLLIGFIVVTLVSWLTLPLAAAYSTNNLKS